MLIVSSHTGVPDGGKDSVLCRTRHKHESLPSSDMVAALAAAQGIAPEKFMGDVLGEGLHEAFLELTAQRNERLRAARPNPAPPEIDPETRAALDEELPF